MEKSISRKTWQHRFWAAILITVVETTFILAFSSLSGTALRGLILPLILAAFYGRYFCFHVKERLPSRYDEEQIDSYIDGSFRLRFPGVVFNNRNWPHIVKTIQIWSAATLIFYPPVFSFVVHTFPVLQEPGSGLLYILFLLSTFSLPPYFAGRKYE